MRPIGKLTLGIPTPCATAPHAQVDLARSRQQRIRESEMELWMSLRDHHYNAVVRVLETMWAPRVTWSGRVGA